MRNVEDFDQFTTKSDINQIVSFVRFELLRSVGRGEFGDSLGTLRNGMLSELSWKDKSDSGLDLSGRESLLLVISDEFGGFLGNLLIDVEDEGVHDAH